MGYNRANYAKVKMELERRREEALESAKIRLEELHECCPEIRKIDAELSQTGILVMGEIAKGGADLDERIENIKLDNMELQAQRKAVLARYGYPEDYSDIKYTCSVCSDTGSVGTKMCRCMKKMLSVEGMKSAGISKLFETQNFDTFSLSYYAFDQRVYNLMKTYFSLCVEYAESFNSKTTENLLFCGNTGLGKTHLSTAIAAEVIEKGYDVCYNSVQNIMGEFEAERFQRAYNDREGSSLDKYFECDLLIIDDLGTESATQFTVSCLYNIVNTRVVSGKPIIINTNLTHEDMRKKYSDRIASRLFGEFTVLHFQGRDIRFLKLED